MRKPFRRKGRPVEHRWLRRRGRLVFKSGIFLAVVRPDEGGYGYTVASRGKAIIGVARSVAEAKRKAQKVISDGHHRLGKEVLNSR